MIARPPRALVLSIRAVKRPMWQQHYAPIGGSLAWSALIAALPVVALLYAIGVLRVSAWKASLTGLLAAAQCAQTRSSSGRSTGSAGSSAQPRASDRSRGPT